jgi:hypothetical protein
MILKGSYNSGVATEVMRWFGTVEIFEFCHLIEPESDIE